MKRKITMIMLMLLVSAAFIYFSKGLKNSEALKQDAAIQNPVESSQQQETAAETKKETEEIKEQPKGDSTSGSNNTPSTSTGSNSTGNKAEPKPEDTKKNTTQPAKTPAVQSPNIIITDTVAGKIILSQRLTYSGETVAIATTKALDASKITYKTTNFGGSVYFSSIGGVKERSAGASSGWCFYVNGEKLNVGAGSYKLKKDDKLEWKFLKDGLTN